MPLTSVFAVRTPCRAGDSTVIVAPGIDKPSFDVMVPVMTPDWRPWAATGATPVARPATRAAAHARRASTFFIADPPSKTVPAPDTSAGGTRWDDGTDRFAGSARAVVLTGDLWWNRLRLGRRRASMGR